MYDAKTKWLSDYTWKIVTLTKRNSCSFQDQMLCVVVKNNTFSPALDERQMDFEMSAPAWLSPVRSVAFAGEQSHCGSGRVTWMGKIVINLRDEQKYGIHAVSLCTFDNGRFLAVDTLNTIYIKRMSVVAFALCLLKITWFESGRRKSIKYGSLIYVSIIRIRTMQ